MDKQEIIFEQAKQANQLREKFFFHWALLATGTFSLLIPFLQSLEIVLYPILFILIGILLTLSLIFSSLRNFFAAQMTWYYVEENAGETKNIERRKKLGKVNEYVEFFSIGSFILAVILTVIFININLLCK